MQGSLEGCDDWFWNPSSRVSAHYGIGKQGEIHQYVKEENVAFHAGSLGWNIRAIGVEFEGFYPGVLTQEQISSFICIFRNRPFELLRHSDINPLKPNCPGPMFPLGEIKEKFSESISQNLHIWRRPCSTHT